MAECGGGFTANRHPITVANQLFCGGCFPLNVMAGRIGNGGKVHQRTLRPWRRGMRGGRRDGAVAEDRRSRQTEVR